MKKIAIAGFGTVGGGIAHLLRDNQKVLADNAGENISLGRSIVDGEFKKYNINKINVIVRTSN